MTRLTREECRTEITRLHEFFVAWYCGEPAAFGRVESALAPGFERISPAGERHGREAVLESVRETRGAYDPGDFDIEIRNVTLVDAVDDRALVTYEEHQTTPDETNARVSTALLADEPDAADHGTQLRWHHLQETWLDSP